jgi:hypothetical protein
MADTDETSTMLLDELAALDPKRRRELAAAGRSAPPLNTRHLE